MRFIYLTVKGLTRVFCGYVSFSYRWTEDEKCIGPFPKHFESYDRTLRDLRKSRFGKSPTLPREIEYEFKKPDIVNSLGKSLYRNSGPIYNGIQIERDFANCIFSSPHAISLVKEHIEIKDRFFLMDATFRITPRGSFQQVLIIYVKYGIKVRKIVSFRTILYLFANDLYISDVSTYLDFNDTTYD